jgi:hypothetical protein
VTTSESPVLYVFAFFGPFSTPSSILAPKTPLSDAVNENINSPNSPRRAKMPIQETFSLEFANYLSRRLNRDKDGQAVNRMYDFARNVDRCKHAGVTYGLGSWGYTGQFFTSLK